MCDPSDHSRAHAGARYEFQSYFAKLILFTSLPIAFALALALVYLVRTQLLRVNRARCQRETTLAFLLVVYLLLPPISLIIFRGILCEQSRACFPCHL